MVNQQLVEYVKQQLQGGIQKDAVKKALVDAGWPEADVNDSMIAASATPAAVAPVTAPVQKPVEVKPQTINPVAAMGGPSAGSGGSPVSLPAEPKEKFFDETHVNPPEHEGHGSKIALVVMGAIIVALLVALGYIYFGLNGKVTNIAGTNPNSPAELDAARNQVQQLTTDNAALNSQVALLASENQDLNSEFGFMITTSSTSTEVTANIKGLLSGATGAFSLTTKHGAKVNIKNSKDAKADAALKPLLGQSVTLTGTHKPGEAAITVTAVNGISLSPPPAATTTPAAIPAPPIPPTPATSTPTSTGP